MPASRASCGLSSSCCSPCWPWRCPSPASHPQNWDSGWWSEIAYAFSYGEVYGGLFTYGLWELFTSTGWLCGLFWIVWLWVNDLRHNPRAWRHSLLSTWGMKRPLQKRLVRRGWLMAAAAVGLAVIAAQPIALLAAGGEEWALPFALVCGALCLLLALALVLFLRNERQLAQDMGSLVEQIASVRAGNLSLPLERPRTPTRPRRQKTWLTSSRAWAPRWRSVSRASG